MNAYSIAPLIAVIAYIPLLVIMAISRPWQKRYTLFGLYIIAAMIWSTIDILLRGDYFPESKLLLFKLIVISYFLMAVQFHLFTSSFFPKGQGRWLLFAYGSFVAVTILVSLGYVTGSVEGTDSVVAVHYTPWIVLVFIPLMVLVFRNCYVFIRMLKYLGHPIMYNQIIALLISIGVITVFTCLSLLPMGNVFPIPHYGNLINAFVLSYAVIRHRLIDIKLVIRRGTAWAILGALGMAFYWLLLIVAQKIFNFNLDIFASVIASVLAICVALIIYFIRGHIFHVLSRVFKGTSYDYQQKLNDFTNKIHNIFSLKEQGGELLNLLVKALNVKQACLLFPEADTSDLKTQLYEPKQDNRLAHFKLRANNPIVKYLEKEKKYLSKENLAILPSFLSLWPQEREEIESKNIAMFVPLISRDRLIAILVLSEKYSGHYSLEDINIIETATSRVAVSMEKEYLSEQLREREQELSVINNSSVILSSSLDIQEIFGSFTEELKKVVDISWASIVLIDEEEFVCAALTSTETAAYQIGDRVPMERTGTAWVVSQKKPFIEPDLAQERYFTTSEFFYNHGMRSTAYIPLIAKGRVIGSFILVSKTPYAFSQRHIRLLEQLASQIAMPLENSQLYARAEKKARIDELTGLYNRRSLDEMIDSEISRHSRYGGTFSLAILDLDSFKTYNDTYGHLAGDGLLKAAGRNIKSAVRTSDYAFRYGGDEFAILLPQTSMDDALLVLERVREKITDGIDTGKIGITASIGVACWPDDGISHTDIIASADVTLYRAKRNGRNQTLCASGPLSDLALDGIAAPTGGSIDSKLTNFVNAFAEIVDSRSYHTQKHSKKVADFAIALARELELNKEETAKIETCAMLHDVGKVAISSEILNKSGDLTESEWKIMRTHPQIGAKMIKQIPQLVSCAEPILHHHEKYDGTGYPDGQKGENIPIISRILAIANEFAAMTSERSYSEKKTYSDALGKLKKSAGTQFDPYLVERFVSIFETNVDIEDNQRERRKSGLGPASST